jgi:hypothetical protein
MEEKKEILTRKGVDARKFCREPKKESQSTLSRWRKTLTLTLIIEHQRFYILCTRVTRFFYYQQI